MPSYVQWRQAADKGQVARVTWLCGDQRVLVEEVIEDTKRQLNVSEFDYVSLSGEGPSVDIWDASYQYSLDPSANRLVLVREADQVQEWGPLKQWFQDSRKLTSNYILFVSDNPNYPTDEDPKNPQLLDHIELIRTKGKTVRCSLPSGGELVSWVKRNSILGDASANFLISRCGGDLNVISNICKKSMMFSADPGNAVVSRLADMAPALDFSDSLLMQNKKAALKCLESLAEEEYARVVGLLYSRLDLLYTLHKSAPNFSTARELSEATGIKVFLIQKYGQLAKSYSKNKITQCRNALTVVDDALQRKVYESTMELLVALW